MEVGHREFVSLKQGAEGSSAEVVHQLTGESRQLPLGLARTPPVYYTILYYTTLYYIILYYTIPYYIILYYTSPF